ATNGGWVKTSENITVSGGSTGCTAPAGTTIICSPPPNTTVGSPVHVVGSSSLSPAATSTLVYLDGVKQFSASGPSVDTNINATTGTHYLTVQSYNGAWVKAHEYITVGTVANQVTVSVSPASANIAPGATQQFTATVQGTTNTAVTWSVDSVQGGSSTAGTISTNGLYTAPSASGTHTVTATSQADTTKSSSATVG